MPNGRINIVNRDEYHAFVPSPIEEYKSNTQIKSVRFEMFSHDEEYERLRKKGSAFLITSPELYVNGQKPIDGIFSPLYGADTTQDTPIYTCECHELTGGNKLGMVCPRCGQVVRTIEADLRIKGYVDIAPYHILSYHGFNAMKKIYKNMNEIITKTRKISRSGKLIDNGLPTLEEIYDDYEERYEPITGIPKKIAFMSKIPVYSARLRPLIRQESTMTMTILDVNKRFLSIATLYGILKSAQYIPNYSREIEIQKTLNQLQQDYNEVASIVNDQLNGKHGVFRRAMASGRLDHTSRLVITLGEDLRAHEIDVPYQTVMVQYEEEIANYLSRIQDISLSKAMQLVDENQLTPTPLFKKIISQLLRSRKGMWALVNRNPTISETGIIYCRIRKIHDNPNDMTLHLPQDVLAGLAADRFVEVCLAQ